MPSLTEPQPERPPGDSEDSWDRDDVVLVQDWIGSPGGAELVIRELASMFPRAPILTLFAVPETVRALGIDRARVRQSYLGRVPAANRLRRFLVPWFADAIQTLDVGDAALIVSASHAVAKSIPHRSYQRHVSYVYSPARYAHDLMPQYLHQVPAVFRPWMRRVLRDLATWDVATASRVARYIGISREVAARIWRTYRRRAAVIHPPVHIDRVPLSERPRGDYYVVLSRLVPAKRIDLAVAAAGQTKRRLVVVGDGPERLALEKLARRAGGAGLVEFVGRVSDVRKFEILGGARALLFPGEEDFGIVGVEALATGTPVVAFGRAGMLDVVAAPHRPLFAGPPRLEPGGVLFAEQSPEALAAAMWELEERFSPDPAALRALAEQFSAPRFRQRLLGVVRRLMEDG